MKYHLLPQRRPLLQSPRTRPRKATVGVLFAVGGMDATKGNTHIAWMPPIYDIQTHTNTNAQPIAFLPSLSLLPGATSIEQYCLRRDTWRQVATMCGRRLQFGVAVLDNRLYVVGGRDGLKTLNTVECYNPLSKGWSIMPPMSTHRHGLGRIPHKHTHGYTPIRTRTHTQCGCEVVIVSVCVCRCCSPGGSYVCSRRS